MSEQEPDFEVVRYARGVSGYRDAATYDAQRYEGAANEYKSLVLSHTLRKLVGDVAGKRLLDVACGTGRGLCDFVGKAALVVGADASPDMLRFARAKLDGGGRQGLVASYAQTLPFSDNQFDIALCLNCLHLFSVPTQQRFVEEMKRVLRPGGSLILEFDNALHGVVVGPFKRLTGRERGALPAEIRQVIGGGCRVVQVYGAVFPVVWRWFHRAPRLFFHVEKLAHVSPVSWLAHRRFYKVVKDG